MIKATSIDQIETKSIERLSTGLSEVDKLLGGGLVTGSVLMFAGEPGVGKSTLWLQVANNIAKDHTVLYASGEESLAQTKMRADRLNALNPKIICSENIALEDLEILIDEVKPRFVIVDSLQMVYSRASQLTPGTPTQMKKGLLALIEIAKSKDIIIVAIGHCTKSGLIAGLLTLQHMVDVTLFMRLNEDGTRSIEMKKNRFGSAQTTVSLEMTSQGFKQLSNSISIIRGLTSMENTGGFQGLDLSTGALPKILGYLVGSIVMLFVLPLEILFKHK